jgi:hypothetical protein
MSFDLFELQNVHLKFASVIFLVLPCFGQSKEKASTSIDCKKQSETQLSQHKKSGYSGQESARLFPTKNFFTFCGGQWFVLTSFPRP